MKESLNWAETNYVDSGVEEDLGAIASTTSVELDSDLGGESTELHFNSALY